MSGFLNGRIEAFVDKMTFRSLADIEKAGLMKAKLRETPWSGDYWPIYLGILAQRYADPEWKTIKSWSDVSDFYSSDPLLDNADVLSPAEKYGVLTGDDGFVFRQAMVNRGKSFLDADGEVPRWMGICEGWSAASFMAPRPLHAVRVWAPAGQGMTFYPADIKGLTSLLWSAAKVPSAFAGLRCNKKADDIKRDPDTGRILDPECFDVNPGFFHLALVNQLGQASLSQDPAGSMRTLVMDATYDAEVWNQPIYGYEYAYFDPRDQKPAGNLSLAMIERASFPEDRFSKWRDPNTKWIVGIALKLDYVSETTARPVLTDSPQNDALTRVTYLYDLELDQNQGIIGGEWYQDAHPDFLWVPVPGSRATMPGDSIAEGKWDVSGAFSAPWLKAIDYHVKNLNGYPFAAVVDGLLDASRSTEQ
jgi:hypothetical protein